MRKERLFKLIEFDYKKNIKIKYERKSTPYFRLP